MSRLALGIDPSLTATGLALLEQQGDGAAPGPIRCRWRAHFGAPDRGSLVERLRRLVAEYHHCLEQLSTFRRCVAGDLSDELAVAIEDPTDFWVARHRSSISTARLGAAVGALMLETVRIFPGACTYGVRDWLGQPGSRRPAAHGHVLRVVRARVAGLADASDDETMAAGLALHHLGRLAGA